MKYKTINTGTILKKITRTDNLFRGDYTVDPFQNCEFGCVYCDSSFEKTVYIKNNAVEILNKELQKTDKKGRVIIGSVHDPYQPIEKEKKLTREILKLIKKTGFSCHILTKSNLVLRDLDLIQNMDCWVTLSISSIKNEIAEIFEPNTINPSERLDALEKISNKDIKSGLAVIPFMPYIMEDELKEIVRSAAEKNAEYILFRTLELRGDLKKVVFEKIKIFYPDCIKNYKKLYKNSFKPNKKYEKKIFDEFRKHCSKYNIKKEI